LAGSGIEELFVFVAGSGADAVEAYVRRSPWAKPSSVIEVHCVRDRTCASAGDALRELDKRNVIKSDPFVLVSGDVVTNVDVRGAMAAHRERKRKDNSAIMTVLFKEVGGWDATPAAATAAGGGRKAGGKGGGGQPHPRVEGRMPT